MENEQLKESIEKQIKLIDSQPEKLLDLLGDIEELQDYEDVELNDVWYQELLISLFRIGAKNKDRESLEYILDLIENYGYEDSWDIQFDEIYPEFFKIAKAYFPEMRYDIGERVDKNLDEYQYITFYEDGSSEVDSNFVEILPYMTRYCDHEPDPEVDPQLLSLEYVMEIIDTNNGADPKMDEKYIDFLMEEKNWFIWLNFRGDLNYQSAKNFLFNGLDYLLKKGEQDKHSRLMDVVLWKIDLQPADLNEKMIRHLRIKLVGQESPFDLLSSASVPKKIEETLRNGKLLYDKKDKLWNLIASKIFTEEGFKRFSSAQTYDEIFSPSSLTSQPQSIVEASATPSHKKSKPQTVYRKKKPYRPKGLKGQFYGLYKWLYGKKK